MAQEANKSPAPMMSNHYTTSNENKTTATEPMELQTDSKVLISQTGQEILAP